MRHFSDAQIRAAAQQSMQLNLRESNGRERDEKKQKFEIFA